MIHERAIVNSSIPDSCIIHPYTVIGKNVKFGVGVIVHPFVVVGDDVEIGDHVEIFSGACIGKEPKGAGVLSRKIQFDKQLKIGRNSSIGVHAVLYYDVEIGQNCLIGDGASIREQCNIGSNVIIGRYVTLNYNIVIGNRTKIMDHAWLAGNMTIGDDVFISGGVLTANDNKVGADDFGEHVVGPTIEDQAKIGVGAILLPSVTIGKNSLVAAGAVVTRDVLPNSTVKGMPAKP